MKGPSSATEQRSSTCHSTKPSVSLCQPRDSLSQPCDSLCQPRDNLCLDNTFARVDGGGDAKSTFRHNRVVCDCDTLLDASKGPSGYAAIPNTSRAPCPPKAIPNTHWRRHDPSLWQSVPSIPADAKVHHKDWFQTEYGGAHAETKNIQNQERADTYFTDVQTRSQVYGGYHYYDDDIHSCKTDRGDRNNKPRPAGTRYENTENWKYQEECKRAQIQLDTQRKNAIKTKTKLPELSETRATKGFKRGTIQDLWPDTKYPNRYSSTTLNTLRKLGYKDSRDKLETALEAKKLGPKKNKVSFSSTTSIKAVRPGTTRTSSNTQGRPDYSPTIHDSGSYHDLDGQTSPVPSDRNKFARFKALGDISKFREQFNGHESSKETGEGSQFPNSPCRSLSTVYNLKLRAETMRKHGFS